ncbi:hypothetical protein PR048_029864 [Dryococelus australis]|uniref:Uncharacterized protein n=1 Tax=Dryococelus australis TaxID=614101 RepID=A0ABQ9GA92_9NEOP|nr:hypothetical protein PR048_029864 [Dryococelus australis]
MHVLSVAQAWQMYRGEWRQGEMHGSGTYTWDAFSTQEFAFPQANVYRGRWEQGRQHGPGVLLLGRDASITGNWERGLKHGAATIICSNGSQPAANTVFHYDNLVLDQEESAGTAVGSGAGDKLYNREQNGDILLYAPEHEIDLTFYQELVKTALSKGQDEDEEKHKKLLETALQSDENRLRQVILLNTPLLRQLYYKYSTTACHEQPSYRPVMARIMLWQMFRDIGVQHRNISLVELDQALGESRQSMS